MRRRAISSTALAAVIIVALVAVIAGFFVFQQLTAPSVAERPLRIGFSISISGDFAVPGRKQLEGIELWKEWINAKGGIFVKDQNKYYKVELVYYDDKSSKDEVIRLYEKLINEDKVDILISPYSSTLALTAAGITEKYWRLMVVVGANSDRIFQQGYKNIVGTYTPASKMLTQAIDILLEKIPSPTVAIIYKDDAFAKSVAEGAKAYAEQKGVKVAAFEMYPRDAKDLSPILTKVKGLNVDAILGGGHYEDEVLLVRQAKELAINVKLMSLLVSPSLPAFYEALKETSEGILAPSHWEPQTKPNINYGPSIEEFMTLFRQKWNSEPSYHSAAAFAAGLYIASAIEKAGTIDNAKLRQAFNELDIVTFYGRLKIDPVTGNQVGHELVLLQWQKGQKQVVWPKEVATASLIYPKPEW
uniref:Branched-chain amino acid ABC transporter substrate-binding protein n=1 Tax=Caldiarchaeum subterraneum TaxID=311458 RepID=A0A7C5Y9W3_CALS0